MRASDSQPTIVTRDGAADAAIVTPIKRSAAQRRRQYRLRRKRAAIEAIGERAQPHAWRC